MKEAKAKFEERGYKCEIINLNEYIEIEAP
jgi:hypothetical protein